MLSKKTLQHRQKQKLHWKDSELGSSLARLPNFKKLPLRPGYYIYSMYAHSPNPLYDIYEQLE